MKLIKVTQNHVGRYSLGSNEETLSFYMGIYEDNKIMELDGDKAILHYSGDPDEVEYFEEAIENIEGVFQKCFDYAERVWSTTDYKSQCIAFAKLYTMHLSEIEQNMLMLRKARIEKEIAKLTAQLNETELLYDISDAYNDCVTKRIRLHQKWLDEEKKKLSELKDNAPSRASVVTKIEKYDRDIKYYESLLMPTVTQ